MTLIEPLTYEVHVYPHTLQVWSSGRQRFWWSKW